jgi:hypothetical protein
MQDAGPAPQIYFFRTITNGIEGQRTEGLAFASKSEAWEEAAISSGEIIREMDGNMSPGLDWRMEVLNPAGDVIYRLSFKAEELNVTDRR